MSRDAARRFLVARHGLAPPRALPARPESVLAVVRRLGSLQFDPLAAPGARNHEIVLHARIRGYERGWCETWLYGSERRLFEAYNKSLNILPVEELPYHRRAFLRGAARWGELLAAHEQEIEDILATIEREGPRSTAYFSTRYGRMLAGGWGPTKAGRLLVEALFKTGRLGIARRDGNVRYYDRMERLFPRELLEQRVEPSDSLRHQLLTRFRGHGLLGAGGSAEITVGTGRADERKSIIAELVQQQALLPVAIEGVRGIRYVLADEMPLLDARRARAAVVLLAPLDPFVWDRRLLRELFGFEYTWEVYTPVAKRKHGYYVLPVLYGDQLVGRIEPRFNRNDRVLSIACFRSERSFTVDARFRDALADALEAYRHFVGAERIRWQRGVRVR